MGTDQNVLGEGISLNGDEHAKVMQEGARQLSSGNFVILLGGAGSEGCAECALMISGELVTSAQMSFMIRHTTGLVRAVTDQPTVKRLGWSSENPSFHVSLDFRPQVADAKVSTIGASAKGRCETLRALCRKETLAEHFTRPGHVFVVAAEDGASPGGSNKAALGLCQLTRLPPVVALAELMTENGEIMMAKDCILFAKKHGITVVSVAELEERLWKGSTPLLLVSDGSPSEFARQKTIGAVSDWRSELNACSTCTIPVRCMSFDTMRLEMFQLTDPMPIEVVACIKGKLEGMEDVAIRIHSECFTGDVLRSAKCDCGLQLEKFFQVMEREASAVLLYIRGHEGRGIGLKSKFDAYRLQTEELLDTVDSNVRLGFDPDLRSYKGIAEVLIQLGIKSVRIFSNNKEKIEAVRAVMPCKYEPLKTKALATNQEYLRTKERRMRHLPTMSPPDDLSEVLESHAGFQFQVSGDLMPSPKAPGEREAAETTDSIEWPRFGMYTGFHIVIVHTAWHLSSSSEVINGCESVLLHAQCEVTRQEVPGGMDLVAGCRAALSCATRPKAVVALGTFVRGETDSSSMQFQATLTAIQEMNASSSVPVICGVVFYNTWEDAYKRNTTELGSTFAKNALQMASVCLID